MKNINRIISLFLALITILGTIHIEGVTAEAAPSITPFIVQGDTVNVYGGPQLTTLRYNGQAILGSAAYYDENGEKLPAYCLQPNRAGAAEHPDGNYDIKVEWTYNDPQVVGMVLNGWPYKTPAELGVSTELEAYEITKAAIWTVENNSTYSNLSSWSSTNNTMLTAFKNLVEKGKANTAVFGSNTLTSTAVSAPEVTATYTKQTFKVDSNFPIDGKYTVSLKGTYPPGTEIRDASGSTAKTSFGATENFTIYIPASGIPANSSGNVQVDIRADLISKVVFAGPPVIDSANKDYQDYLVPKPKQEATTSVSTPYAKTTTEEGPPTKLKIKKVKLGTTQGLAGAIFEIRDENDSVLWTGPTDANGEILFQAPSLGKYSVEEIVPPHGYQLSKNAHQDIVLKADMTTQQVTFENAPTTTITVIKVDADTNELLPGSSVKLASDDGHQSWSGTTDASGKVIFENLPDGTYTITELVAPKGYLLDAPKQTIKVVGGVATNPNVYLKNHKGPWIKILKVDETTGLPLAGAEFSVKRKDGSIVFEGITDETGVIEVKDLKPGWYTITELAAPEHYLKRDEYKDVELKPGQQVQIKFDNRRRPALEILKLDEETMLPLAGAKFRVTKTEDKTTSEYVTDKTGKIVIEDLDEAIYTVEEIVAPNGYIITNKHQDISLEWGKTKTLVFTNRAKPRLRIQKVDSVTGELLKNAEFRVEKVEDKTVSEYILENGEITLENLDEAIYKAIEFMAPDGYIALTESKQIMLEWGKTKTLKFDNIRKPVVRFSKRNGTTGRAIPGATFKVEYELSSGSTKTIGTFVTDKDGLIVIPKAEPGYYIFTEILPAPGYSINKNPIRQYFGPGDNAYAGEYESLYKNVSTGKYASGYAANDGTTNASGTENGSGSTGNGSAGSGSESNGSTGNSSGNTNNSNLSEESGVSVHSGSEYYVEGVGFNWPLNSIVLKKADANTGKLLDGAVFELYRADEQVSGQPGTQIGRYTTDTSGVVVIVGLEPGYYVAKEVQAPQNYILAETSLQNGFLKADGTTVLEMTFRNYPYGNILIKKIDAVTKEALAGVKFKVTDGGGKLIGNQQTYTTDAQGEILISNVEPGAYVITETETVANYAIDNEPKTIQVGTDGKTYTVEFKNQPFGTLVIKKSDAKTKEPLADAEFKVTTSKGTVVGTSNGLYKTDVNGLITIPNLPFGSYIYEEIKAPEGYVLEHEAQSIDIDWGKTHVVDVYNNKKSGVQIIKIDAATKEPIKDAKFKVYKKSGDLIGEYSTDGDGLIILDNLEPGWYKALESKAPDGYKLDDVPKDFEVTHNQFIKLVFENVKLASLTIKKVNSETREPIEGVRFSVTKINGEKIGEFNTNKEGFIFVNKLLEGSYIVTELKAPDGYIIDPEPKHVEIKYNKPVVLEVENKPASGLLIVKTDSRTGKPLQGVVFDVKRADGQRVQGNILDQNQPNTSANSPNKSVAANGDISGSYTTDANGRILINTLTSGEYHIVETKALPGYELDTDVHSVTVTAGKLATVQLKNKPMGGLRIKKINSVTGQPIYNVEFRVYDFETNKEVGGPYYSDNNGIVDFDGILPAGRYKIIETRPAEGYLRDDIPKTIEFKEGSVTEIEWKNTPNMGQIQITKKSADDNEINGLPKGTVLEGATFEVYAHKSGNVVDQFTTGKDGRGVSRPLPAGRYLIKEVKAPKYYKLSDQVIDCDLEFSTQILKYEFTNESANIGVAIKKVGPIETMVGQQIRYDFKQLQNQSTVPLTDFYVRDVLPANILRLDKIVTGTYNQSLRYKIMFKTNKNDYRIIADNLSSVENHVIDTSGASLGLHSDEYVTEFMMVFGNVKAGFSYVENPFIFCTVKSVSNVANFANKADIGGKYGGEWYIGNSTWLTRLTLIKIGTPPKYPQTGY